MSTVSAVMGVPVFLFNRHLTPTPWDVNSYSNILWMKKLGLKEFIDLIQVHRIS